MRMSNRLLNLITLHLTSKQLELNSDPSRRTKRL